MRLYIHKPEIWCGGRKRANGELFSSQSNKLSKMLYDPSDNRARMFILNIRVFCLDYIRKIRIEVHDLETWEFL